MTILSLWFLPPGEVFEMDIQDIHVTRDTGNRYLLIMVDKASKLIFGLPIHTKKAMAKVMLDVVLTFSLPVLLRNDPGTEFTAEVVEHLIRWLNLSSDYRPVDHARAQGTAEKLGG